MKHIYVRPGKDFKIECDVPVETTYLKLGGKCFSQFFPESLSLQGGEAIAGDFEDTVNYKQITNGATLKWRQRPCQGNCLARLRPQECQNRAK